MKYILKNLLLITSAMALTTATFAMDKQTLCKGYANSAISQQKENETRSCGLSGPEWSSNYDYHYKWCMHGNNSSIDNLNRGRSLRRGALQRTPSCAGHQASEFSCETYAKSAVSSNDDNMFYGCGFTDDKWSSDYMYHYKWCSHGDNYLKFAGKGSGARKIALEKCRGCWNYAFQAVKQNDLNLAKKCNLTGPKWKSDFNYHNQWCLKGNNLNFTQGETNNRWDKLNKCTNSK